MSAREELKEALIFIISNIVEGDNFSVDSQMEENKIMLSVRAEKSELGKIIGRGGETATNIRKVLRAMGKKRGVFIRFTIDNKPM